MRLVRAVLVEQAQGAKLSPVEVLYMEDGGPKRCDRCAHFINRTAQCELFREEDQVSGPDGVCLLYANGEPLSEPERSFIGLSPAVAGYGADKGMGGYSCGNCWYGSGRPSCAHPALTGFKINNVGGCCNAWTEAV